jgi:transcription elongation factor Elf1
MNDPQAKHPKNRKRRKPRRVVPIVTWTRARCPFCNSVDLKTTGTIESGPALVSQHKHCRTCGKTFVANGK